MKKLLLLTIGITTLSASQLFAQPRKGSWMVGADVVPFSLKGGYFLSDRLMVGTGLLANGNYAAQQKSLSANITVSPFLRYYFARSAGISPQKFYFFLEADAAYGYGFSKEYINNNKGHNSYLNAGIAPGIMYMVSKRVSVDAALRFNYLNVGNGRSDFGINTSYRAGFQIYLGGKKKASLLE